MAVVCGLVSDQGTRFRMLQLRVCMPELKILHVTTMTWCSRIIKYINNFFFFLRMEQSRLRAWNGFIWPWVHRCGDIILLGQFLWSHGRCGGYPGGCGWMDNERTWKGLLWDAGKRDWGLSKAGCRDFMPCYNSWAVLEVIWLSLLLRELFFFFLVLTVCISYNLILCPIHSPLFFQL